MARVTMSIVHDQDQCLPTRALFPRAKGQERDALIRFSSALWQKEHTKKIINRNFFSHCPRKCRAFSTRSVGISLQSGAAISHARGAIARMNNELACFARSLSEPRHATVTFPSDSRCKE